MIVVMAVTLYTTRLVLNILGETDYGIYNIIGGIVVMFSFLNTSLTTATQRFLSYALGKDDTIRFDKVLNASIGCYIIISILILVLAETVGLWFVNYKLTIPIDKMYAANVVYQFTIATFIISILRIPFESVVIATEKMSFYAYLSVVEAILKFSVVGLLYLSSGNKLINYAALMMMVPLGCNIAFQIYCRRTIGCKIRLFFEKSIFKELFGYTGWSMLGGTANVIARQGGNILMNMFYGVLVNAAFGVASQINAALNSLVGNFQTAFKPQIIKLYAAGKYDDLNLLIYRTSKFSFFLTLILLLPIAFNIFPILELWLDKVPKYSGIFAICLMTYCAIDAIQAPLIFLIYAHSNIKEYQLWLTALLILNLPVSFVCLKMGFPPTIVLYVYVVLNFISACIRTVYVKKFTNFPSSQYLKKVVLPSLSVSVICLIIGYFVHILYFNFTLSIIILIFSTSIIIYLIGLNKQEKNWIRMQLLNKLRLFVNKSIIYKKNKH